MQQISLLQTQQQALQCVLDPTSSQSSPWKVLVFDTACQNILSTLYKVGDLRELCITLHLNINQKRERLHGVRVLYFVTPTSENIKLIIEDFQKDLYTQVIVNFCSPISEKLLEQFAQGTGRISGAAGKVERVLEHNLDFTSLNSNLYTFGMNNVYSTLKRSAAPQPTQSIKSPTQTPQEVTEQLASHLYSLISTIKVNPLIIYQIGKKANQSTSQLVGQLLIQKLAIPNDDDNLEDRPQAAILLLERDDDLNYLLQHSNTYAALMHDIFRIQNNKVSFKGDKGVVQYDLSPLNDTLWAQALNLPYPEAADLIDKSLVAWKSEYDKVIGGQNQPDHLDNMLSSALDVVPQLEQKKRTLDQHINIASAILQHAKQRQLDKFYQCGLAISQTQQGYLQSVKEIMASEVAKQDKESLPDIVHLQELDRVRILILLLLNAPQNKQFNEEFTRLEQQAGIKDPNLRKSLMYVKEKVHFGTHNEKLAESTNDFKSIFKGLASKVKTHSKGILQNVSNYLPTKEKRCAVVSIMETLFDDFKQQELLEYFKIYDQRRQKYLTGGVQLSQINEIIVCVLEGGSLNEYAEVCEYAKLINRNIIYGSSQILNAEDILQQFEKCLE